METQGASLQDPRGTSHLGGLNSADRSPGELTRGLRSGRGTLRTLLYTHQAGAEGPETQQD